MSVLDSLFGSQKPEPETPAETLRNAVMRGDAEAALYMLHEVQQPCARRDLAKASESPDSFYRTLMSISEHLDGTETISLWRTQDRQGGTLVASIDQQACKR